MKHDKYDLGHGKPMGVLRLQYCNDTVGFINCCLFYRLYLCGIFEEPLLEVDEEAETLLEQEFQEESAEVEDT